MFHRFAVKNYTEAQIESDKKTEFLQFTNSLRSCIKCATIVNYRSIESMKTSSRVDRNSDYHFNRNPVIWRRGNDLTKKKQWMLP